MNILLFRGAWIRYNVLLRFTIQEANITRIELRSLLRIANQTHICFTTFCLHVVRQPFVRICCDSQQCCVYINIWISNSFTLNLQREITITKFTCVRQDFLKLSCNIQREFGAHVHAHRHQTPPLHSSFMENINDNIQI